MKTFAILLVLPFLTVGNGTPAPRIVGGQEAAPHSIPYQAYLKMSSDSDQAWTCSGTIISRHYILTSGRCAQNATYVRVILGAHNISSDVGVVTMDTVDIYTHPEYRYVGGIYKNDIALLRMEIEMPFHAYIQPIALPSKNDLTNLESFVGYTARASGWGLVDGFTNTSDSDVLEYFDAEVIKTSECIRQLWFTSIDSTILCTSGSGDVGICDGDVGGPLVADSKLIGVNSFWPLFCLTGYPSGYTRVSSFIDWIVQNSDVIIS